MPAAEPRKISQEAFEQALENRLNVQRGGLGTTAHEIRRGMPFEQLETITRHLELTQETITRVLGISERTFQRRKESGRLNPAESDRFGRLARVYHLALHAFDDDQEEARHWLTTSKRVLDGETPVEHLDTEPGERTVEQMLIMIDQTIPA